MDGSDRFVGGQHHDHALDLTPLAEVDDVADIAAMFGARSSFEAGFVAIGLDQIGRVLEGGAIGDVNICVDMPSP